MTEDKHKSGKDLDKTPKSDGLNESEGLKDGGKKNKTTALPEDLQTLDQETTSKKHEAHADVATGMSEIAQDILKREIIGTEQGAADKIIKLDKGKESKEQKENWDALQLVSYSLISRLLQLGVDAKDLQVEKIGAVKPEVISQLPGIEKIALLKIQEVVANAGNKLSTEITELWKQQTEKVSEVFAKTVKTKDAILNGKEPDGWGDKFVGWVKENPKTALGIVGGIAVVGIAYYLLDDDEEDGKKTAKWKNTLKKTLIAGGTFAVSALVTGTVLDQTSIGSWISGALGLEEGKVSKFVDDMKNGKPLDAITTLLTGDKKTDAKTKTDKAKGIAAGAVALVTGGKASDKVAEKTPEKQPEKDPDRVDVQQIIETSTGKMIGISKESWEELKGEFKDKPNVQAFLKKYENNVAHNVIHNPYDFASDLLTAAKKDGVYILVGGGAIILSNGYKFITVTSAETLLNTMGTLLKAPFKDNVNWSDAIFDYTIGTVPFMVVGAGWGSLTAKIGENKVIAGIKGAGRGFIFPVEVARVHAEVGVKAGRWSYRTAKGTSYTIEKFVSAKEAAPAIQAAEANFYAETAKGYDKLIEAKMSPNTLDPKKWYAKLGLEDLEQLKQKYLAEFAEKYKKLPENLKLKDASGKVIESMEYNDPIKRHETEKLMKEFTREQNLRLAAAAGIESSPVEVKGKPNTYRFAGQEFKISPHELADFKASSGIADDAEAIRNLSAQKVVANLAVEEVAIVNGKYRYKIGGQWIETLEFDNPAKAAEVKTKFTEVLAKEQGISIDFEKLAKESPTMKFFPVLEKTLGTAGAVLMIYHLETATDKRKAVADTAAGFGAFWAGMKLTDWSVGSKIGGGTPGRMAARTVVDIMGGIAAAYGFNEPIGKIVEGQFAKVPGSYGASNEMISLFEKATTRSTIHMALQSAEKGLVKEAVVKAGLTGVSEVFEKKVGGVFMKKIGEIAAKQGFKQVLKAMGWKGATTLALLADDATAIGVVDDVIAAGLALWMAKDIYDIVKLIANAQEVQVEMEKRSKKPITGFTLKDAKSRAALQEKLSPLGKTVDQAHELGEAALFDHLRLLPEATVEIKREGMPGRELWILKKGEVVGISILGEKGETIASISDTDASKIDETLQKMESK